MRSGRRCRGRWTSRTRCDSAATSRAERPWCSPPSSGACSTIPTPGSPRTRRAAVLDEIAAADLLRGTAITARCTCPYGGVCKHCVAVALRRGGPARRVTGRDRAVRRTDVSTGSGCTARARPRRGSRHPPSSIRGDRPRWRARCAGSGRGPHRRTTRCSTPRCARFRRPRRCCGCSAATSDDERGGRRSTRAPGGLGGRYLKRTRTPSASVVLPSGTEPDSNSIRATRPFAALPACPAGLPSAMTNSGRTSS